MEKYKCPNCGSTLFHALPECPICGGEEAPEEWSRIEVPVPPKPENATCVHLCGETGELVLHSLPRPMEIGAPVLAKTCANVRCISRVQFIIRWQGHSCFIAPAASSKNATAVNGRILNAECELQQGDTGK